MSRSALSYCISLTSDPHYCIVATAVAVIPVVIHKPTEIRYGWKVKWRAHAVWFQHRALRPSTI